MKRQDLYYLAIFALILITLIPAVSAQTILDPIANVLRGDWAEFYKTNAVIIDAIVYFLLFWGLCKKVFKEKFGTLTVVAVTLIPTIGMIGFEWNTGFNFFTIWWFVAILLFIYLGHLIYSLIVQVGAKKSIAFAIAGVVFLILLHFSPQINQMIQGTPTLSNIFDIATATFIVFSLWSIWDLIAGIKSGENSLRKGDREKQEYMDGWNKFNDKEEKDTDKLLRSEADLKAVDDKINSLEAIEANLDQREVQDRQQEIALLSKFEAYLKAALQIQQILSAIYKDQANPNYEVYKPKLGEWNKKLQQYIGAMSTIAATLERAYADSTATLEKEDKEIEPELQRELDSLATDDQRMLAVEKDIEKLKDLDIEAYAAHKSKLDTLKKQMAEAFEADITIKQAEHNLQNEQMKLHGIELNDKHHANDMVGQLKDSNQEKFVITYQNTPCEISIIREAAISQIVTDMAGLKNDSQSKLALDTKLNQLKEKRKNIMRDVITRQKTLADQFANELRAAVSQAEDDYIKDLDTEAQEEQKIEQYENEGDPVKAQQDILLEEQKELSQIKNPLLKKAVADRDRGARKEEMINKSKKGSSKKIERDKKQEHNYASRRPKIDPREVKARVQSK